MTDDPKDLDLKKWLNDFDPLGMDLDQDRNGDVSARRELLRRAADQVVKAQASFSDPRLWGWLVEFLEQGITSLPKPRGRPDKTGKHFVLALRVEILRLDPNTLDEQYDHLVEKVGLTVDAAIDYVSEATGIKADTIRRYHDTYRQGAKRFIEVHGPRLPHIS